MFCITVSIKDSKQFGYKAKQSAREIGRTFFLYLNPKEDVLQRKLTGPPNIGSNTGVFRK